MAAMIRHRVGAVILLVLGATTLSACSPIPDSQLGLRRADGGLELVFALCRGERATDVFVREAETKDDLLMWHASAGPDAPERTSVRLFEPVDGWLMPYESLTTLEPGIAYDAYLQVGGRRSELLSITLEAAQALGPGEVLGRGEQGSRAIPMSEYDFREAGARSCRA